MKEKPKKGIALVLGMDKDDPGASEEEEGTKEAEIEAMQAFESAKTSEAKAAALKDFIKLCTSAGDY